MLEDYLDHAADGPAWLADERVAKVVADALHFRDGRHYRLDAFSVMPNHVHVLFKPFTRDREPLSLSSIMHSLKRHTAKTANLILKREGAFWEHESFDHFVRNQEEHERIVYYILENPVKAGLVETWHQWPWNYVREGLLAHAS